MGAILSRKISQQINGFVSREVFKALGWSEFRATIKLDGMPIKSFSIKAGEEFRTEEILAASGRHLLSIECDRFCFIRIWIGTRFSEPGHGHNRNSAGMMPAMRSIQT
jgi:hypothetical protein